MQKNFSITPPPSSSFKIQPKSFYLLLAGILVIGIAIRFGAVFWNTRLQGDVNLFALTAREMVNNGRLFYPMKYEYSDQVTYLALSSPASQHPPLWMFLAGIIGKILNTQNTFLILKFLSFAAGLLLLFSIIFFGKKQNRPFETIITLILIAGSPMLIDFSANGSPYIFLAVLITMTIGLLSTFPKNQLWGYIFGGVITGLGFLTHSAMVALFPVFLIFWLWKNRGHYTETLKYPLGFCLAFALIISPWIIWNFIHFGKPFYSYSTFYILKKLHLAQTGIYNNVVTTHITGSLNLAVLKNYLSLLLDATVKLFDFYLKELGPFATILAILGIITTLKTKRRDALAIFLPTFLFALVIMLWATFKSRFIVPLLPTAYILAAFGFVDLFYRKKFRLIGIGLLTGAIFWNAFSFINTPTRYYEHDEGFKNQYAEMLFIAKQMRQLPSGVVLGYANALDGGIETVYWNQQPYAHVRGLEDSAIQKIAKDFSARYIWTDKETLQNAKKLFPSAKIIFDDSKFYVLEIP